jgi:hypothetical protein
MKKIRLPNSIKKFKDWSRNFRRLPFILPLYFKNKFSDEKITEPKGAIVSLTTHGIRLKTVYLTIESIARGYQKPYRIVLWLDNENLFHNLPQNIINLKQRGLEVRLTKNYGPHTKYYPQVIDAQNFKKISPLVTADDDMLYPKNWLKKLIEAHNKNPNVIYCWRAKKIKIKNNTISSYKEWSLCDHTRMSFLNFAEGVSGVIYPIELQNILYQAGDEFLDICPKADDVWLHMQTIRNGFKVCQLENKPKNFPCIPGTEKMGLVKFNVTENGNDSQIQKTYKKSDVKILLGDLNEY